MPPTLPISNPKLKPALFIFLMAGLLGVSCARRTPEVQHSGGLTNVYEAGSLKVAVKLDKREMTVAEQLQLTIEATAPEGYEIQMPGVDGKVLGVSPHVQARDQSGGSIDKAVQPAGLTQRIEQFTVVTEQSEHPAGSGTSNPRESRSNRSYILEPFLAGEYRIPALRISCSKPGGEDRLELETEVIGVSVRSLLSKDPAAARLRGISPPVNLPASHLVGFAVLGGLAAAGLIGGAVGYLLLRRTAPVSVAAPLTAQEVALQALDELVRESPPENGQVKNFYQRLTSILRQYIEARFGLHPLEQTTTEFLASLGASRTLHARHKELLTGFLKYCDYVKFAEHQPTPQDLQDTIACCRRFIEETADAI
jgi:hypothetical protein